MMRIKSSTNLHSKELMSTRRLPMAILMNTILTIFSISFVYPIIWIFQSSIKSTADFNSSPIGIPRSIELDSYIHIIGNTLMPRYIFNSFRITVTSLIFIVLIGFITGYFLSRYKNRYSTILYAYYMIGLLIPIHALLVPLYIVSLRLSLVDTMWALVLPYIAFGLPIAVFLAESYIHSIPHEMEEAASIDGASFPRVLFTIILPMTIPILVTIAIIQFFATYNEFMFALILLNSQKNFTVPLGLTFFRGPYSTNYPMIMSATFISIAPVLILYIFFNKQIIKGIIAGAVKG